MERKFPVLLVWEMSKTCPFDPNVCLILFAAGSAAPGKAARPAAVEELWPDMSTAWSASTTGASSSCPVASAPAESSSQRNHAMFIRAQPGTLASGHRWVNEHLYGQMQRDRKNTSPLLVWWSLIKQSKKSYSIWHSEKRKVVFFFFFFFFF